eukprot:GHVR01049876.1.p1 GENE.GHVR01049876.1~~GHVR01049876.1.p1  ORF type:complete len:498 (+),score=103.30 GHVR01049876.1:69-1562(+)
MKGQRKFNILSLEEGEEYFCDFSAIVNTTRPDVHPHHVKIFDNKGRVRVCSKSLIFEPDLPDKPLVKFPFKYIKKLTHTHTHTHTHTQTSTIQFNTEEIVYVPTKIFQGKTRCVCENENSKGVFDVEVNLVHGRQEAALHTVTRLWDISKKTQKEKKDGLDLMMKELISNTKFDYSQLDHRENVVMNDSLWVEIVKPLRRHPGMLLVTEDNIYFQPCPNFSSKRVKQFPLKELCMCFRRSFITRPCALELIGVSRREWFIVFLSTQDRETTLEILCGIKNKIKNNLLEFQGSVDVLNRMTELWQSCKLSNYHYLDFLNCAAGRSRKDFAQYPVFPWVLSDYTSKELDLSDPSSYRDLSTPIGAYNKDRLKLIEERMNELSHEERFQHGSHYSTPSFVVFWLVRQHPECLLRLHMGRFDVLARCFHSVGTAWNNAINSGTMEMIPQFYESDETFLLNTIGVTTSEGALRDVDLPPWSRTPKEFLSKMREALELTCMSG